MLLGDTTELPERVLNSLAECFEGFRKTQRNRFDVTIGQHAVEQRVFEGRPGDLHGQGIADREVAGGEPSGMVILRKEDSLVGPVDRPPLSDPSFERPSRGVFELTGVLPLQIVKEGLRLQPRLGVQELLDVGPDLGEGVGPGAVVPLRFSL